MILLFMIRKYFILILFLSFGVNNYSQQYSVNYDELEIRPYRLPSILTSYGGKNIENIDDWERFRKQEIIHSFVSNIYGRVPGDIDTMRIITKESDGEAFDGIAKRKQLTLVLEENSSKIRIDLLIYLPKTDKKVPVFLGYNFFGNHTITDDQGVGITNSWVPKRANLGMNTNIASEESRGIMKNRWPVEKIIKAGYGLVTLYCGDIDPDKDEFNDGVHSLFYAKDQERPSPDEWGTIAAWSWGLSRIMDYLEDDEEIDDENVIVFGHSRLGKAALWTAASDHRFAACIANNSGCMGAALSRRKFGETVEVINKAFPHWFCGNFKKYSNNEDLLPVDQHILLALIAPRPLYVASASEDLWADPKGEFLSLKHASVVYNLYGIHGFSSSEMPRINSPVIDVVSYHIRAGKHDVTEFDWEQYITFARKNLTAKNETRKK